MARNKIGNLVGRNLGRWSNVAQAATVLGLGGRRTRSLSRIMTVVKIGTIVFRVARTVGVFEMLASRRASKRALPPLHGSAPTRQIGSGLFAAVGFLVAGRLVKLALPSPQLRPLAPPVARQADPRLAPPVRSVAALPARPAPHHGNAKGHERVSLKGIGLVAWDAAKAWSDRRASSKGAALALYTLLSLAPILILVLAAAGLFIDPATVQTALLTQMKGLMGPAGADAVKTILVSVKHDDTGIIASVISAVVVLVSATTAFAELKDSLDELWQVQKSDSSGLWGMLRERLLSVGVLMVLALMLLSSLALSAGLDAASGLLGNSAATMVGKAGALGITYIAVTVLFAVIFKLLPAASVSWTDVSIGSAITGALFLLGKTAIGFYLAHGGVSSAYGAAGSVVALVIWIYYSAQIFFYGALFTHGFAMTYGSRQNSRQVDAKPVMSGHPG